MVSAAAAATLVRRRFIGISLFDSSAIPYFLHYTAEIGAGCGKIPRLSDRTPGNRELD
jgi:hypothetical protein